MNIVYSDEFGLTKIIGEKQEGICELCGKVEEIRPYGPNGENVCFSCGMKNEAAAKKAFAEAIRGVDTIAVILGKEGA